MWRSQLWKEHAHELVDREKGLGSESQSEHDTARYFGCEDDRWYAANLPRYSRNFTKKVSMLYGWVSKLIVEAAKKKKNSQESPKTLYPKWIFTSPFLLLWSNLTIQLIDGSIPLTYLSREVIHTAVALAQQNEAQILIALNKCDLMKPATLIQERKKLIVEEVPSLLRPSVCFFVAEFIISWESKTTARQSSVSRRLKGRESKTFCAFCKPKRVQGYGCSLQAWSQIEARKSRRTKSFERKCSTSWTKKSRTSSSSCIEGGRNSAEGWSWMRSFSASRLRSSESCRRSVVSWSLRRATT